LCNAENGKEALLTSVFSNLTCNDELHWYTVKLHIFNLVIYKHDSTMSVTHINN